MHASEVLLCVKEVEYARVRVINFTSAKKLKADLDANLDGPVDISGASNSLPEARNPVQNCSISVGRGDGFFLCRIKWL